MTARASGIAVRADDPRVFVGHPGPAFGDLVRGSRRMAEQDVDRLESGDGARDAEIPGHELVGLRADDGADVAGIEEARDPDVSRLAGWPAAAAG